MGYHKQQLIADQVEVGDRLPAPIPARHHVALRNTPSRKDRRLQERIRRDEIVAERIAAGCIGFVIGAIVVLALIAGLGDV